MRRRLAEDWRARGARGMLDIFGADGSDELRSEGITATDAEHNQGQGHGPPDVDGHNDNPSISTRRED